MLILLSRAAARIVSFSPAVTILPSIVSVLVAMQLRPNEPMWAALHERQRQPPDDAVGLRPDARGVLLAEVAQRAQDRVGGGLPQAAQAGVLHHVAQRFE